jgi:hypothetical protein
MALDSCECSRATVESTDCLPYLLQSGPSSTSHLESTITRLLVATKQLLEGLAKWSRGEVSEEAISAIYVKLGNDFNVACAAFARENISMKCVSLFPACFLPLAQPPPSTANSSPSLPTFASVSRPVCPTVLPSPPSSDTFHKSGKSSSACCTG